MTEARIFVLRDDSGNEHGVFTGKQPRQAALKAANKGDGTLAEPITIKLRERGTKKLHVFKAWKAIVDAPKNKPMWMPDRINKPFVCKMGMEAVEKV